MADTLFEILASLTLFTLIESLFTILQVLFENGPVVLLLQSFVAAIAGTRLAPRSAALPIKVANFFKIFHLLSSFGWITEPDFLEKPNLFSLFLSQYSSLLPLMLRRTSTKKEVRFNL